MLGNTLPAMKNVQLGEYLYDRIFDVEVDQAIADTIGEAKRLTASLRAAKKTRPELSGQLEQIRQDVAALKAYLLERR